MSKTISVTKIDTRKKKVNVSVELPEWRQFIFA